MFHVVLQLIHCILSFMKPFIKQYCLARKKKVHRNKTQPCFHGKQQVIRDNKWDTAFICHVSK
jgi:hypothetical protein